MSEERLSTFIPVSQEMLDDAEGMSQAINDGLTDMLLHPERYPVTPPAPAREVGRFRRWLGWKTDRLARWLNPEIADYYDDY